MLPLVKNFRARCDSALELLRAGELASSDLRSLHVSWEALEKEYVGPLAVKLPKLKELSVPMSNPTPDTFVIKLFREIVAAAPQLTTVILEGEINGYALEQMDLIPNLESLYLRSSTFHVLSLRCPWKPFQPRHLWKLRISGIHAFTLLMFRMVENTAITHLRIKSYTDDNASDFMAGIMRYRSLTDLWINIAASGDGWTGARILVQLKSIPNLTSFRFFVRGDMCDDEPANLTDTEAEYICQTWPNLRVVGVALADFAFFQAILDLQRLEELELNAWLWPDGGRDSSDTPHTTLRSLRFTGSPPHWGKNGPVNLNLARFRNLQGPEIIRGNAGVVKNVPRWARAVSSEVEDD